MSRIVSGSLSNHSYALRSLRGSTSPPWRLEYARAVQGLPHDVGREDSYDGVVIPALGSIDGPPRKLDQIGGRGLLGLRARSIPQRRGGRTRVCMGGQPLRIGRSPAPVAQRIERSPPEREVGRSNRPGRVGFSPLAPGRPRALVPTAPQAWACPR